MFMTENEKQTYTNIQIFFFIFIFVNIIMDGIATLLGNLIRTPSTYYKFIGFIFLCVLRKQQQQQQKLSKPVFWNKRHMARNHTIHYYLRRLEFMWNSFVFTKPNILSQVKSSEWNVFIIQINVIIM